MARLIAYATLTVFLIFGGVFLFLEKNTAELFINPAAPAEGGILKYTTPLPPPEPLENPPSEIKAVYATNWSAATPSRLEYLIDLIDSTELNAIVIDVKDYSGYVGYDTAVPEVEDYNAEEIRIADIDSLVRRLHEKNIYVIARTTMFQDPRLALARSDLAVQDKTTGKVWKDRKGLSWMDPSSQEVWDYNIKIVRDVLAHGFDEVNFDYIRFPSDGNIAATAYPFWDEVKPAASVIRDFFRYLRKELPDAKLSADLFGQATVDYADMGIGQIIEHAYESFDYVSPMVYPSHYVSGFIGLGNPADYPYEVVKYSMDTAVSRLGIYRNATSSNQNSKLRPWLQAFDLGAVYTPEMVREQIRAAYEAATSTSGLLNGFMLWSPSNVYDRRVFSP
ncbi:hypothetical protein A2116_00820 [Candidatus Jorgensenbacteria bacterium GWA1_49_17]|uniref:DUF4015 domain-containing protein n=2 Tax=Candidatus Joergenseniibacteriota TaxID=1752739 RepID=A0A1F6BQU7_9BACT|nr:MAG: hypothetical protein A2127_00620 [Candidatus Jorgensenbacteria bacterium GWC1_48_12]OGG40017.1 MAG: hypothetical protein A2116_00820 [Candidatus Jorgensenbacteria bacterium GWA1_49_17]